MWSRRGKSKVTGWKFGSVEVTKAGWRKWHVVVRSPSTGAIIEDGTLSDYTESDARKWSEKRWEDLAFLSRLQRALNTQRLSPQEYYQILAKREAGRGGCQKEHTHSMQCRYHVH